MGQLSVFNFITLNGFYKGVNNDISWHNHGGAEEGKFSEEGAQAGGIMLFGRTTYEMMASFWPTPQAAKDFPVVADGMNKSEKIVFSRSLQKANWKNTRIVSENMVEEVVNLKNNSGKNLTILGSGSIVTQLTDAGLIDEYQFMIDPVALGEGVPVFNNIKNKLSLALTKSHIFESGIVLLCYVPEKR